MSADPGARDAALRNLRQPLAIALGILVVDQLTKIAVSRRMLLGEQTPIIDGLLNLVHARNPGAAFSFLSTAPEWFRGPFFISVTVVAILAVLTVVARSAPEDWLMRLALGGILGGALGNLVDRLLHGEVIDFIDVYWRMHHWPAFNVADSAISISVATIFAQSLFGTRDPSAPTGTPPRP